MAKINNIELKAVRRFADHEGFMIAQGNVYFKNKKLGFWSQDSWGGPDRFDFDEELLSKEVESYRLHAPMEKEAYRKFADLSCLLCDLLALTDEEKTYKKGVKKGFRTYVSVRDALRSGGYWSEASADDVLKKEFHQDFMKKFSNGPRLPRDGEITVTVYGSPDDFVKTY